MKRTALLLSALILLSAASDIYAAAGSTNYTVPSDAQGAGGGEDARSTNYLLEDTLGEQGIGFSGSPNYLLYAGYRQTTDSYISIAGPSSINMGTIMGTGQATASGSWTVITDNPGGYSLTWTVQPTTGASATGSLRTNTAHVIRPLNITGGLVLHWRNDETIIGQSVYDASENGNHGTMQSITAPNGPNTDIPSNMNFRDSRSLSLDGGDDTVLKNPMSMFPSTDISVSFWMKSSDAETGTPFSYAVTGSDNEFLIYNYTSFEIYRGASARSTGISANDGNWHHIVVTWQSSNGGVALYKDGVSAYSNTGLATGTSITNGGSIALGQEQDSVGAGFTPTQAFAGLIDDARVYNRVLTLEEVKALYNQPQTWSVAATDAGWGARLRSVSTDGDSRWGTDSVDPKWLYVGDGNYIFVQRPSRTTLSGSTEIIQFRTEIGASKIQLPGEYSATVLLTAISL